MMDEGSGTSRVPCSLSVQARMLIPSSLERLRNLFSYISHTPWTSASLLDSLPLQHTCSAQPPVIAVKIKAGSPITILALLQSIKFRVWDSQSWHCFNQFTVLAMFHHSDKVSTRQALALRLGLGIGVEGVVMRVYGSSAGLLPQCRFLLSMCRGSSLSTDETLQPPSCAGYCAIERANVSIGKGLVSGFRE